jgi:hypothetical protein
MEAVVTFNLSHASTTSKSPRPAKILMSVQQEMLSVVKMHLASILMDHMAVHVISASKEMVTHVLPLSLAVEMVLLTQVRNVMMATLLTAMTVQTNVVLDRG